MEKAFNEARRKKRGSVSNSNVRGEFVKINAGYSFGGGQTVRVLRMYLEFAYLNPGTVQC